MMTNLPDLKPVPAPPPPPQGPQMVVDGQTGQVTPSPQMQQYQQIMQQYQQAVAPILQANQQAQQQFEAACKIIKDDMPHGFRIDIEADSTIEPDEQAEKQSVNEFMGALVPLLQQIMPISMGNPAFANFGKELVTFAMRHYRIGRSLEDSMEKAFDTLGQMPPPPQPGQDKQQPPDTGAADAQAKVASTQIATQGKSQDAAGANQVKAQGQQMQAAITADFNNKNLALMAQDQQQNAAFKAAQLDLAERKQASQDAMQAARMSRIASNEAGKLD